MIELADVLNRPHLTKPLSAINRSSMEVFTDYATAVEVVWPTSTPRIARDPDDNDVLACAIAAQADAIVSGDGDLLTLEAYQNISILTAAEALDKVQDEAN